jgi:hypothetical protein
MAIFEYIVFSIGRIWDGEILAQPPSTGRKNNSLSTDCPWANGGKSKGEPGQRPAVPATTHAFNPGSRRQQH